MKVSENLTIPYAQYAINEHQLIICIPIPKSLIQEVKAEGFHSMHWGKLNDLGFIMECQCRNSLTSDKWDFEKYPNPQIVILSQNTEGV